MKTLQWPAAFLQIGHIHSIGLELVQNLIEAYAVWDTIEPRYFYLAGETKNCSK